MALINTPPGDTINDPAPKTVLVRLGQGWISFFQAVFFLLTGLTLSGTTANRPTINLWIGEPYFDTTLGKPIWVKSTGPTVWVDATGAPV